MCLAVTTAEIAADADHAAYLRDMTEAYPWEDAPMTEAEEAALAASVEPVQTSAPVETWRTVFRDGFAPILPVEGLEYVAELLRTDGKALIQGATTYPSPLVANQQEDAEKACFLGACGMGAGRRTVDEVSQFFAQACWDADQRLGEPAACRHFINWFDDTPRAEMRRELLAEVERELDRRLLADLGAA